MKISTKGRYGLRVMVDLAIYGKDHYVSLNDISLRQEISVKYLEQIMRLLTGNKLIKSTRGINGGYKLREDPSKITTLMVLEALEGDLTPLECINDRELCSRCGVCYTHSFWKDFDDHMRSYLNGITIADIATRTVNYNPSRWENPLLQLWDDSLIP